MKSNIEFIVFAIRQAKDAEQFGFTRNESCRNLKTALHQYWQNKTLGFHGQSQKHNIPKSKRAAKIPIAECDVEHVVPVMYIVNVLMDMDSLTAEHVECILRKYFQVLVVSKEEHQKLNASGLRSKMPSNWDGENIWSRYDKVGIERENS